MDNPEEIPMDTVRTGNEHVRKTRKMRVIRTKTTELEVVEKERNDEGEGVRMTGGGMGVDRRGWGGGDDAWLISQ